MKKILALILVLCLSVFSLLGCEVEAGADAEEGGDEAMEKGDPFVFRGTVFEISEFLSVNMEETAFSSGPYHVLTSSETVYYDENGAQTNKDAIQVGSVIEITFSGQVMMSYPPKIAAKSIKIVSK